MLLGQYKEHNRWYNVYEMDYIKVSVVIPTYNDSPKLCLEALAKQTVSKKIYEVVVVNNASNKVNIKKITDEFKFVKYLRESRKGVYYARNTGWRHAKGDIIAFTDADCIPDHRWIEKIILYFKDLNHVAMGGSIIKSSPTNWIQRNAKNLADGQHEFRYKPFLPNYPYVVAANMVFRKKLLKNLNGFVEKYSSGGDAEFCWRLQQKGYKLELFPDAKIFHPARSTIKSYFKQSYNYGVGHPLQFKSYYPHSIKIFIDFKNIKNLLVNVIYLPFGFVLKNFGFDKNEKFAKSLLEVVRTNAVIWGRIKGSVKYKVIYI